MLKELPPDETVELATFGNWNEAEIAKSFLDDFYMIAITFIVVILALVVYS